jgi:predicted trehalose synthase
VLAGATGEGLEPRPAGDGFVPALAETLRVELESLELPPALPRAELAAYVATLSAIAQPPALLARIHGDLHLGQVLRSGLGDWVVIDYEGEPARPLEERRAVDAAARDAAGMLRSFAYAAAYADAPAGWEAACRTAFLEGWLEAVDPRLVPEGREALEALLALYELQKLLYELRYERAHRPDWVRIPAGALARILGGR